jgi:hypothetical protein
MSLPSFKKIHSDISSKFKDRNIGMISGHRAENSVEQNNKNHSELHKDLKTLNHTVHHAEGGFVENKGKHNEKEITEPSYLVLSKKKGEDHGKLLKDLTNLGKKYNQDSILHKPHHSDIASFHGTKKGADPELGHKQDVGKVHWDNDVEDSPYFSKVKGRKFTFK